MSKAVVGGGRGRQLPGYLGRGSVEMCDHVVAWLVGTDGRISPPSLLPDLKLGFYWSAHLLSTRPGSSWDCLKGKLVGGTPWVVELSAQRAWCLYCGSGLCWVLLSGLVVAGVGHDNGHAWMLS